MTFKAIVNIMPRPEILDPQGKATQSGLKNLGYETTNVRVGRRVEMEVEADTHEIANEKVQEACKKLLANTITEVYQYELSN